MDLEVALEELALGEASLADGTKLVSEFLRGGINLSAAHKLYQAISSWTWKSIDTRRRDEDLGGWMILMNRLAAALETVDRDLALRIEGFSELIQISLTIARSSSSAVSPRGKHAIAAMSQLLREGGTVPRKRLLQDLELKPPHLSNIMGPLQNRGYVERHENGREVTYRLTETGVRAAMKLARRPAARPSLMKPNTSQTYLEAISDLAKKLDYLNAATLNNSVKIVSIPRGEEDAYPFLVSATRGASRPIDGTDDFYSRGEGRGPAPYPRVVNHAKRTAAA